MQDTYTAPWTRKKSTARLERDLIAAWRSECERDEYHGFTCNLHRRRRELEQALKMRAKRR